jgi:hypothetical protein
MKEAKEKRMNPNTQPHVLNFKTEEDLIKPHLSNPKVETALLECMNEYIAARKAECILMGFDAEQWDYPYNPAVGPWEYAMEDYPIEGKMDETTKMWNSAHGCYYWIDRALDLTFAALDRGELVWEVRGGEPTDEEWEQFTELESQFYPQEGTYEWYQLRDGHGYWTAPWLKELGAVVFPELTWKAIRCDNCGLAYGSDETGRIKVILDLFHFELPVERLVQFIEENRER